MRRFLASLLSALMLLAALAFVFEGIMATGLRAAAMIAAPHADCPGHHGGHHGAKQAHRQSDLAVEHHDLTHVSPEQDQNRGHDLGHLPACCMLVVPAVLPRPGVARPAVQMLALKLDPVATAFMPGVSPDGPRKPPRTSDEG